MLVGTADMTITPPPATPLVGSIQRSKGVHDDLHARALVLKSSRQRVAIICFDLVGMDFALADAIRTAICDRTGIAVSFLNCSHTHSAPFTVPWSVLGWRWLSGAGKGWRDDLVSRTSELVSRAEAETEEAVLRVGRAAIQIGSNRRLPGEHGIVMKPNPDGVVVPWVDVLVVDRIEGRPAAILFTHAAHPVIIHGASRLMSADYPVFATRKLQHRFDLATMTIFGQACGANINADPLRGGFEAADRAGSALAEAAFQAACRSRAVAPIEFRVTSIKAELPLQPLPTYQECSHALSEAEDHLAQRCGGAVMTDEQLWDLQDQVGCAETHQPSTADDVQPMAGQPWWLMDTVLCLRDLMNKIEHRDERPLRFEAHMLRIGDEWSLCAATHELFAEYQLWLDSAVPTEHSMVLAYTNGCEGYIPTDRDLAMGGYEAATFPSLDGAALRYHHRRALRPGCEQQVIERLRALWA